MKRVTFGFFNSIERLITYTWRKAHCLRSLLPSHALLALGRSGQEKVSSPVWKGHLCATGDPTADGLLDQPRMVEKGPSRNKLFFPSFILSLSLYCQSTSFSSFFFISLPRDRGTCSSCAPAKRERFKKRTEKTEREGGVGDRPWPISVTHRMVHRISYSTPVCVAIRASAHRSLIPLSPPANCASFLL